MPDNCKTCVDVYDEIGIPCYYCEYPFTPQCEMFGCLKPVLCSMCEIAENMVLDGEY